MIEWLPWLPSKSCYTNLKFFETLKDTPNPSKGFRFVAFLVLEILGGSFSTPPPPLVLGVGTKTLGARRVKYNTLLKETEVSSPYVGRVRIPNMTVMRIENAKFTDKGHVFFCELSVYNRTEKKQIKILTTKTLKTVYGKFSRFILFSFGLIN